MHGHRRFIAGACRRPRSASSPGSCTTRGARGSSTRSHSTSRGRGRCRGGSARTRSRHARSTRDRTSRGSRLSRRNTGCSTIGTGGIMHLGGLPTSHGINSPHRQKQSDGYQNHGYSPQGQFTLGLYIRHSRFPYLSRLCAQWRAGRGCAVAAQ